MRATSSVAPGLQRDCSTEELWPLFNSRGVSGPRPAVLVPGVHTAGSAAPQPGCGSSFHAISANRRRQGDIRPAAHGPAMAATQLRCGESCSGPELIAARLLLLKFSPTHGCRSQVCARGGRLQRSAQGAWAWWQPCLCLLLSELHPSDQGRQAVQCRGAQRSMLTLLTPRCCRRHCRRLCRRRPQHP